jgi:acyl-CoA synthetase (AMP-forming)/AMP-acid ligase II
VALVDRDRALTYDQLLDGAARVANVLRAAGFAPGDPVAAMLEDRVESLQVYLGAWLAGQPIVHVNDRLAAPEVQHILDDSGARVLVNTDGRNDVVARLTGLDALALRVTIGDQAAPGALLFADAIAAASPTVTLAERTREQLAIVGYTSGTTGRPKGAMITHGALVDCVRQLPALNRIGAYGRCAFTGTLSFPGGIWGVILPHLYMGGTVTFLHPYTPASWVEHLERDQSTYTYVPSPFVTAFVDELAQRPHALDSLQTVLHSGSPVPRSQVAALVEVIGDRYAEMWGMTEGVAPFTVTTRDDWTSAPRADDILASAGRLLPMTSLTVLGPDGQPVPTGETGELVVRSDILFSGYLNNPAATEAAFCEYGFRTGDVGRVDAGGYVYVTGRATQLIISGGANVYPAEVEAAISGLAGIAECAVFGLPDARWGEAVTAAVVLQPGAQLSEADVIAHVRGVIASYKRPQRVYFLDALPRTASMKVQTDVLKAQLRDA